MTSPIRYDLGPDRVVTITFDAPGAPVNTMTEAWCRALRETVDRLDQRRRAARVRMARGGEA
jgi:enoyl-CoA hydratase/carnithine racemase